MKIQHVLLFTIIGLFFTSCNTDDQEYEYYNLATPVKMSRAEFNASAVVMPAQTIRESGKIYTYQNYIFVNDKNIGVHIIDNRNPQQPTKINFLKIPLNKDVSIKDDYLYADSGSDLVVFNISDINNIQLIARLENVIENYMEYPEGADFIDWADFDFDNEIIIDWEISVQRRVVQDDVFIDIATNDTATGFSEVGTGGSLARFKIVDAYLYALDNSKINVFDIQNLNSPAKINEEYVTWRAETVFLSGDKLFVGTQTGMYVYDVSIPATPLYISDFDHMKFCDPVVVDGDYAYITLRSGPSCLDGGNQILSSRLEIVNISDIYNPVLQETYAMDEPYGLGTKGDLLFVCDGSSGLKVYNKTNVSDLQLVDYFSEIEAYDVIPTSDKLLMIGNNKLTQYTYNDNGISLLSEFIIQ